jgi:hypothetical protein
MASTYEGCGGMCDHVTRMCRAQVACTKAAQQIARSFYAPTERVASTMTLVPIGVRS